MRRNYIEFIERITRQIELVSSNDIRNGESLALLDGLLDLRISIPRRILGSKTRKTRGRFLQQERNDDDNVLRATVLRSEHLRVQNGKVIEKIRRSYAYWNSNKALKRRRTFFTATYVRVRRNIVVPNEILALSRDAFE